MMDAECSFCQKFGQDNHGKRKWYDEPLASSSNFLLVPAIGALVEGYVMIVSKEHHRSMASLPSDDEFAEFLAFKEAVKRIMQGVYGMVLMFEHGVSDWEPAAGSCIDHAHWQVLPSAIDIILPVEKMYGGRSIRAFDELRRDHQNRSYLYIETGKGICFVAHPDTPVLSQYIRRVLAQELGCAESWDWALFPYEERIRATIVKLKGSFIQ